MPARAIALVLLAAQAQAQVTERIDLGPGGTQGTGGGEIMAYGSCVSADGQYVVFQSGSPNLVAGDTNGTWDVFLRDRIAGTTERVSVDSNGAQANGESGTYGFAMTPEARFIAFQSPASNLVLGDTNSTWDIFVRDRLLGTTERISVGSSGVQSNGLSKRPRLSNDGRFVAFDSDATNLVPGDTNGKSDVFVRDRLLGTTACVSVGLSGVPGNGDSDYASISADGRFVSFESFASDLVPGDVNGRWDVFVRDTQLATTELASISTAGAQGNATSGGAAISADGRYVVFPSSADNLVIGDGNGLQDVFLHDRVAGTTERVSVGSGGSEGAGQSIGASVTPDGRFVVFTTGAGFQPGDNNNYDIYLRDRLLDVTELVSTSSAGALGNGHSDAASITPDGRFIAFHSYASNLVSGDTNNQVDVFLRDRFASGFTSSCDPGFGNVLPCPCGNPPSSRGRGCDNSSATGGAQLSASGIAYLSSDSLVFTTSGEKPTALSILLQGDGIVVGGVAFGQGVRCAGGSLKRLYSKNASAGSITAPDFGAGDPSVSVRSAALGTVILAGHTYAYLVYYRDPIVLGGCSAASTFNATQTGVVSWFP